MQRLYALPPADQLRAYLTLREYLAGASGEETAADVQMRARADGLDAMRRVAQHHGLPEGVAPTSSQHRIAGRAVTGGIGTNEVADAWGRYRFARDAYENRRTLDTAAQRALRRKTSGRRRTHETHFSGIASWLATSPASTTEADYDAYVAETNDQVLRSDRGASGQAALPLTKAASVCVRTNLTWSEVLKVARGDLSHEVATAARSAELLAGAGPLHLVGGRAAALLLGIGADHVASLAQRAAGGEDVPCPVAVVARTTAWVAADLQSYRDRQPWPSRRPNEMQHLIYDTPQLADRLGYRSVDYFRTHLQHRHPRVPPPDGRVGNSPYWLRESVAGRLERSPARSVSSGTAAAGRPDKNAAQGETQRGKPR